MPIVTGYTFLMMAMFFRFTIAGIALLSLFAPAIPIHGQTEKKDKAEAVATAHLIARHLWQTQDIRQVLGKYGDENFFDRTVDNRLFNVFAFIDEDLPGKMDRKLQEQYYAAASNLLYLLITYTCVRKPKVNAYGGWAPVFPPGVEKRMRGKPILSGLLDRSDAEIPKPKTLEEVRKVVLDIEEINAIYRRHMSTVKRLPYKQYLALVKNSLGDAHEFFKPELSTCDDERECSGLPNGSTVIQMRIPGFYYVDLARVRGSMKIINILQGPGD